MADAPSSGVYGKVLPELIEKRYESHIGNKGAPIFGTLVHQVLLVIWYVLSSFDFIFVIFLYSESITVESSLTPRHWPIYIVWIHPHVYLSIEWVTNVSRMRMWAYDRTGQNAGSIWFYRRRSCGAPSDLERNPGCYATRNHSLGF
jgi:hypothetical protein